MINALMHGCKESPAGCTIHNVLHHIRRLFVFVIFISVFPVSLNADLFITEFQTDNQGEVYDEDGEASDWIEIYNSGPGNVTMVDWYLTDDPGLLMQWAFPEMTLNAGQYMLVFASGKYRNTAGSELHANFKLSSEADSFLALVHQMSEDNLMLEMVYETYPEQHKNYSYGLLIPDSVNEVRFFSSPTPGYANSPGSAIPGFVADTTFSMDRGYYTAPFNLQITTDTPGASIIFTLDGTIPSSSNGTRINATSNLLPPVATVGIGTTSIIRAIAVKEDWLSSNVDTQTYLFAEDILQQDGRGSPYDQAVDWGWAGPDWEMDPEIVNHSDPDVRPLPQDFYRVATLSLVMNFDQMFGPNGIYIDGESVERATSIEFINPDNDVDFPNLEDGFQVDGTVQIVGGSSPWRWKVDNLSLRLKFQPDLEFPVFGNSAVSRFDTLTVDAGLAESWHYGGIWDPEEQRGRAQYARDQFTADLQNAMPGSYTQHGRTVLLFINGIFWGMRQLHERPDDNFAASYFGGDNEDYDVLKHDDHTVISGSAENYLGLQELADRNMTIEENYQAVTEVLDIEAFQHYILINYYVGNMDWARHNWYASFNRVSGEGKWRFHSWDAEFSMNHLDDDATLDNVEGSPTNLHHDLMNNRGYRVQFADLAYKYLYNEGLLTPASTTSIYLARTDPIDLVTRLESARWGDNHREPPYTRLDWLHNRAELLGLVEDGLVPDFFNERPAILIDQLRQQGWFPTTRAPQFSQNGGTVATGYPLSLTSADGGTIYYTLDGSDPRDISTGGPLEILELIPENNPKTAFMPTNNDYIDFIEPGFNDSSWSVGTMGAGYENNTGYEPYIDSNLDFGNQVSDTSSEVVYMRTTFTVDSADISHITGLYLGVRYDDGFIAFLNGTRIIWENASGGYVNSIPYYYLTALNEVSDGSAIFFASFDISEFTDLLQSGENVLALVGVNYRANSSDLLLWPKLTAETDLEIVDPAAGMATAYTAPIPIDASVTVKARTVSNGQWSPLSEALFIVNAQPASSQNLVISKINYRPASPSQIEIAAGFDSRSDFEYLELMNICETNVDMSGLEFAAGIDFSFAGSTVQYMEPGQRIVIVSNREGFIFRFGNNIVIAGEFSSGTNLDNGGETLTLTGADGFSIQSFRYNDKDPWPEAADGVGYALVLENPENLPEATNPVNWRASVNPGGDPGRDDRIRLTGWRTDHFTPLEMNNGAISGLDADPDGDGISNLLEMFHGTDPRVGNQYRQDLFGMSYYSDILDFNTVNLLDLTLLKARGVEDLDWRIMQSRNLTNWVDMETGDMIDPQSRKTLSGETSDVMIWTSRPLRDGGDNQVFFQLRVERSDDQ